jgi:hypothetical protein
LNERHFGPPRIAHGVISRPREHRGLLDDPAVTIEVVGDADVVGGAHVHQTDHHVLGVLGSAGVPQVKVQRVATSD